MARTFDFTIPFTAYDQTYTQGQIALGFSSINFNYTLSAESIAVPTLSCFSTTTQFILSGSLRTDGPRTGLSATSSNILLRLPSSVGNQDYYGMLTTSTYTSATSGWTCTVGFADRNFVNTVINLSGSKLNSAVLGTSMIDNPLTDTAFVENTTNNVYTTTNGRTRTVAEHLRLHRQNG